MQMFKQICMEQALEPHLKLMLTKTPVSKENAFLAAGSECISVGHKTKVTKETLEELQKMGVRYLSTRSIGYNHIDTQAAKRLGVTIGNVAYSPEGVAEYTIMLMLMLLRKMPDILNRSRDWDFRLGGLRGNELGSMTVGVIGTGTIGKAVIERLKGFGCRVIAYDVHQNCDVTYVPLEELLRQSDVVTLHTPLNEATWHLMDESHLKMMKQEALLINTGRGALIDTSALLTALTEQKLGGAGLDVVEGEDDFFYQDCRSRKMEHSYLARLMELPQVIVTPHAAYYTEHMLNDTARQTLGNAMAFEDVKII